MVTTIKWWELARACCGYRFCTWISYWVSNHCLFISCTNNNFLLFQFCQYLCNVLLICQSNHDIQLLKLDVNWIIVLDEEHFHLILEDVSPEKKTSVKHEGGTKGGGKGNWLDILVTDDTFSSRNSSSVAASTERITCLLCWSKLKLSLHLFVQHVSKISHHIYISG